MEKIFKAHRGALPPNDAALIRNSRVGMNVWWGHRRLFWLACILAWVLNITQAKDDDEMAKMPNRVVPFYEGGYRYFWSVAAGTVRDDDNRLAASDCRTLEDARKAVRRIKR